MDAHYTQLILISTICLSFIYIITVLTLLYIIILLGFGAKFKAIMDR